MTKNRRLAYLALIGNTILWGLAAPISKKAFQFVTPEIYLFWRYFFATLFTLPYFFLLLKKNRSIKLMPLIKKVIPLEFLGTFVALLALYHGLRLTTSIETSLIVSTWPIFVNIGGILFLKEIINRHEKIGLALAVFGTIILTLAGAKINSHLNPQALLGNSLILVHNLIWTVYLLKAKIAYHNLNKWLITHLSFWVGLIGFGTAALLKRQDLFLIFSSSIPLLACLYMAIGGSIIALTLYLIGQDKIEASEASIFTYLQPLIAVPAGIIFLSESFSPLQILATVIIAFGVYFYEKRRSS